jgi:hypothetical protein
MPSLTIPERYREGIRVIRALSSEAADELVATLENVPPGPTPEVLQRAAAGAIHFAERPQLPAIIRTLISLELTLYESDADLSTFAHEIVKAMSEAMETDAPIQPDETDKLEVRFRRLLECRGLIGTAKAIRLKSDFPNTLCHAKILTDMRPVFGTGPEQGPFGAIITHTLKLDYHLGSGGRHQQFYVGLDADDLENLLRAVQRARQKASSLKNLLQKAGTPDWSSNAEELQD